MTEPQTAIILLNWNGGEDTIECLDSLLRMNDQEFVIVVCDNASTDGSWEAIRSWCETNVGGEFQVWDTGTHWKRRSRVVLIQTISNLGFAGGCNAGIRFALQQTQCEYIWLLNNDTVVNPDSLGHQVRHMRADANVGLLGSTLVYFDRPDTVQCFGGYGFNFWTARVRPLSVKPDPKHPPSVGYVESRMRYVSGASTFVARRFVEEVGLLNEQYFLYFEEIDWAVRGKSFRLSYCPESVVLHKEGRSIGSSSAATRRSRQSELWLSRNRILFTRTYFPMRLPITLMWVLAVAFIRACKGQLWLARVLLEGAWNGLRAPSRAIPSLAEWPHAMLQMAQAQESPSTVNSLRDE